MIKNNFKIEGMEIVDCDVDNMSLHLTSTGAIAGTALIYGKINPPKGFTNSDDVECDAYGSCEFMLKVVNGYCTADLMEIRGLDCDMWAWQVDKAKATLHHFIVMPDQEAFEFDDEGNPIKNILDRFKIKPTNTTRSEYELLMREAVKRFSNKVLINSNKLHSLKDVNISDTITAYKEPIVDIIFKKSFGLYVVDVVDSATRKLIFSRSRKTLNGGIKLLSERTLLLPLKNHFNSVCLTME